VCGAAGSKHADVWRQVWERIIDIGIGEHGVVFDKCKAHITNAAYAALPPVKQHIAWLNREADEWAKQGADADQPVQWHVQALNDQHEKVKSIALYMAHIEIGTKDANGDRVDVQKIGKKERKRRQRRPPRAPRQPVRPHELRYVHGILTCDMCTRKAARHKGKLRMEHEECKGDHAYDRRFAKTDGRQRELKHVIWRTGPWTWCHRCGVHSMHKILGLKARCKGKFANSQARDRRDRLRLGLHPYSGVETQAVPRPMPRCGKDEKATSASADIEPLPDGAHDHEAAKPERKLRLRGKQPVAQAATVHLCMHGNCDNDCRGRREELTGKTSKRAGEELTGKLTKRKLEEKRGEKRGEREEAGTEGEGSAVTSVSALSKLAGPLKRAGGGGSTQLQTQPQSLEGFEVAEAVTQVAVEDASAGSHGEAGWGQTAPGGPEVRAEDHGHRLQEAHGSLRALQVAQERAWQRRLALFRQHKLERAAEVGGEQRLSRKRARVCHGEQGGQA